MKNKINGKKILEDIRREESDRQKISLYLSKGVYNNFKNACGDVPASKVMERLMKDFIESIESE